jgi:hypothetical protein
MYATFNHLTFNDTPDVANALQRSAVVTQPVFNARILVTYPYRIDRRSIVLYSGHSRFQGQNGLQFERGGAPHY